VDEQEWAASDDPQAMLQWLQDTGRLTDRKARLFGVACCRRVGHVLRYERSRRAVEVAERAAEGQSEQEEVMAALQAAWDAANEACDSVSDPPADWEIVSAAAAAANTLAGAPITADNAVLDTFYGPQGTGAGPAERRYQAAVLRDLLGPLLFRPVQVEASWRTPAVLDLAATIYDGHDFRATPVLADALEEAGCDDAGILGHLRQQGQVHVPGCWCLDLVLSKV
jgi:hypothetical protein